MDTIFAAGQALERCVKQPCELCTTFTDLTKVYERTMEDRAAIFLLMSASSSTKWLLWRRQSIFQAFQRQNRYAQSTVEMGRPRLPHLRYSITKQLFYGKLSQDKRQIGRWKRRYKDSLNVSYKDFSVNTETSETFAADRQQLDASPATTLLSKAGMILTRVLLNHFLAYLERGSSRANAAFVMVEEPGTLFFCYPPAAREMC